MKSKRSFHFGNRCGHDPKVPRFCDLSKRGKGGHPPVIGLICHKLEAAYDQAHLLFTWQQQNPSGRGRRTEIRQAMVSVAQYLFVQWFQLDTRRCAVPGGAFLQVPDVNHLANRINQCKAWKEAPISRGRIQTIFSEWHKAGYIISHQKREKKPSGEWTSSPAIRTFTKKFFVELGGKDLWIRVKKAGARKLKKLQTILDSVSLSLKDYLNPGSPMPPKMVRLYRQRIGQSCPQAPPEVIRKSKEYYHLYLDKLCELFTAHPPDDPRKLAWSPAEIADNARRLVDHHFGLSAQTRG